jgi:ubiquinol-cytochrome c reductase cytochrome c1 subunit
MSPLKTRSALAPWRCALSAARCRSALASESVKLDRVPADVQANDPVSLQRGAHLYVNYCLGCHSLRYMRFNRLQDLGLTEQQIRDNLMSDRGKVGDLMKIAADPKNAKEWFGRRRPDLSVIARSRASGDGSGADWLYTYLRGFYRDPSRPTGWNNTVFANVGMPHVLYQLQGEQVLKPKRGAPLRAEGERWSGTSARLVLEKPGKMTPAEYDRTVADLVNFLVYVGEPSRDRETSASTCSVLGVLFVLAMRSRRILEGRSLLVTGRER